LLATLVDTPLRGGSTVTLLSGGSVFYQAELDAIAAARQSVHLEAYVFHSSAIAQRFVEALTERAKNGVRVRLVIDAYGSMLLPERYFAALRKAGFEPVAHIAARRLTGAAQLGEMLAVMPKRPIAGRGLPGPSPRSRHMSFVAPLPEKSAAPS